MLFRHAAKSGAKAFDGIKVNSVAFTPSPTPNPGPGRPVSAAYTRKSDGVSGVINFDYIVDASGRAGVLNTKYLKNRMYNQGLKNVANWAYWKTTGKYGKGTPRENSPFFEALTGMFHYPFTVPKSTFEMPNLLTLIWTDESGWAWFIPLHNGTHSVGVVMNQEKMIKKKAAVDLTAKEFYLSSLKLVPRLNGYLSEGEMVTEVKSASDFSYNSSSYAFPYARTVGDAGCFIDPFFSSGVHLAITGALCAATTICAAMRGDCDEETAGKWHSNKVKEGYSRWLLVVLSAYKQMSNQAEAVLSDFGEDNFDRAFNFFKPSKSDFPGHRSSCNSQFPLSTRIQSNFPLLPVIQGTADVSNKLTQAEFSSALGFVVKAFDRKGEADLTNEQEQKVLEEIRRTQSQNMDNIQSFTMDVIDGRLPRLVKGRLGLDTVAVVNGDTKHSATVTVLPAMSEEATLVK